MTEGMKPLFIGLGNPGPRWKGTRHNIGHEVAERLAGMYGLIEETDPGIDGKIYTGAIRILLPTTFMNASGEAVRQISEAWAIAPEQMIVIHDEIDLAFGTLKRRFGGSGRGGHNGLKSIYEELGTTNFWRLRVGVGRPDVTDGEIISAYALSRFHEPAAEVQRMIEDASAGAERIAIEEL